DLDEGVARSLSSPLDLRLEMRSDRPDLLTRQVGLGDVPLVIGAGEMQVVVAARGALRETLQASLLIEGGEDLLGFSGQVSLADPARPRGNGLVEARLSDPGVL